MIEIEVATRLVEKLSGLKYFPKKPEAIKELMAAIQIADSEAQALVVIRDWHMPECPTAFQLRSLIKREQERARELRQAIEPRPERTGDPDADYEAYQRWLGTKK